MHTMFPCSHDWVWKLTPFLFPLQLQEKGMVMNTEFKSEVAVGV